MFVALHELCRCFKNVRRIPRNAKPANMLKHTTNFQWDISNMSMKNTKTNEGENARKGRYKKETSCCC